MRLHNAVRDDSRPNGWDIALSIGAMTSLAVAQPLLDLLGRNPEFFLARAAPALDVILLGLGLGMIVPVLVAGIVQAVFRLHTETGLAIHAVLLALLGALATSAILNHLFPSEPPDWLTDGFAVATGIGMAWSYHSFLPVRTALRYASIAPLLVTVAFVFLAPSSQLVWSTASKAEPFSATVGDPAPIVMVVLDELPVASIIDEKGNILSRHFPGFARLAEDGTWFRNAVGLHQQTTVALPTIVTGVRAPLEGKVPSAADYPYTVFSLLDGAYEVNAVESVTELCPDTACESQSRELVPAGERWRRLGSDLAVVSGHLFLPDALTGHLPPIDQSWGDFGAAEIAEARGWSMRRRIGELIEADRRSTVNRFLTMLDKPLGDGEFYFAHLMFPHWPWMHLPDGRPYAEDGSIPGFGPDGWSSNPWLVEQAYQRHLLQVQYVDNVVGEIVERLEFHGSYDETMIVVLADHGGAIRPNIQERRWIVPETVGDVAAIPMFIKRPHHRQPAIDDYRAETIDVLPTIADVLKVSIPWQVDGVSLFAEKRPRRTESTMLAKQGSVTYGTSGTEKLDIAQYHLSYFGDRGPFEIAPKGYAGLLGQDVTGSNISQPMGLQVALDHPDRYAEVDLNADFVPALLTGTVEGDIDEDYVLAIAVNGTVEAVTRTWVDDGRARFQAMIPPTSLIDGSNTVEVLMVLGPDDERTLARLSPAS
ncbi:MAG TPA: sulfatase-like hydrolase/transferase [Acidimicrobiia bacterium]|nr:sulfatase-like hydrolase/transferase [Acidimicrobiia bacterium]